MSGHVMKLGIVGLDGHGPAFAALLNGPEPKVEGARVVAAMPIPSVMIPEDALAENVERTRELSVRIVDDPAELAETADGILILHDDGSRHLELTKLFADRGKPLFVDKPLEASCAAARELVEVCREEGCPLFSASSLRFSVEIQACLADEEGGPVRSAMTYSPYKDKPTMPGWFYYGVHSVEPLFTLMGRGCRQVRCVVSDTGPVAVSVWGDGRLGIARGTVGGLHGYGFTAWREKTTDTTTVSGATLYVELLKRIKRFFETGKAPVDPGESLEVVAFMEAANESMARGGRTVALPR